MRYIRKPFTENVIPDDIEQSLYRFVLVASKRARQLMSGARPLLPVSGRKPTVTAMEEVRRGLIKYTDPIRDRELQKHIEYLDSIQG